MRWFLHVSAMALGSLRSGDVITSTSMVAACAQALQWKLVLGLLTPGRVNILSFSAAAQIREPMTLRRLLGHLEDPSLRIDPF